MPARLSFTERSALGFAGGRHRGRNRDGHQNFMLAGPYSVLDNILLGAEPVRLGVIDRKRPAPGSMRWRSNTGCRSI